MCPTRWKANTLPMESGARRSVYLGLLARVQVGNDATISMEASMSKRRMVVDNFTVEGKVGFPIDMLRYDRCWPATQNDAAAIDRVLQPRRVPMRDVPVGSSITLRTGSESAPTIERWRSFMFWRVTHIDGRAL